MDQPQLHNSQQDPEDARMIDMAREVVPSAKLAATTDLLTSFVGARSRRWLLRSAAAGATTLAVTGVTAASSLAVHAESLTGGATLQEFFNILATGEDLFVTFYHEAIEHRSQLGLSGDALKALRAIAVEEQIHGNFAKANGGVPATNHFSMPHGQDTFADRDTFLATQQLAEELTNGALLAFIHDVADMGLPQIARLGGQLMQVEGGHRVVGRVIMDADPWDNWAFGPIVLDHFTDVPAAVTAAGFLSPTPGNDFEYHAIGTTFPGLIHTAP